MALTEVLGETHAAELEREVLESETIASSGTPEDLISAMTRTLAHTVALEPEGTRPGSDPGSDPSATHPGSNPGAATQVEIHNSGEPGDRSGEVIHERYQLVRQLGKGGMGTVYIARHITLPKTFAVKVLNRRYAKRKDIAERFLQEARAVSLIDHENVVGVIDFGSEADGSTFLVMEHLRGESLSAVCKREAPLAWERVRHIMEQMCRALQAAHDVGIVHRDIKPENVLRVGRHKDPDFIKVLDFGLAKMQVSGGLRLTQTGMVLGTPDYMSPEQARGRTADHRADIYASGVMMYELLCGRVPFSAKTFGAMRQKHLLEPPEPPSKWAPDAGITSEMDAIVLRALAKDPEHRFASMSEMGEAIVAVGTTGAAPVELLERRTLPLLAERSVLDATRRPVAPTLALVANEAGHEGEPKSRVALVFAVLGLLALAGLGTAYASGMFEGDDPVSEGQAVVSVPPSKTEEVSEPPPVEDSEQVALHFLTNVPVVVLDGDGQARFGEEPTEEIEVPRSDEPLQLVLRAQGHRDLHVVVTPDRDRSASYKLEAEVEGPAVEVRPVPAPVRRKSKSRLSSEPEPEPEPIPEPEPEPEDGIPVEDEPLEEDPSDDHSFSPEIVDPFDGKAS